MKHPRSAVLSAALITILSATLAGCAPAGDKSTPIDKPAASAEPTAEPESTEPNGSRDRPYLAGTKARLADDSVWTIGFQPTNLDAAAAVIAENEFNTVVEGRSMVMTEVSFEVNGDTVQDLSSGVSPFMSLTFEYVTAGGVAYGSGMDDYCGVVPNSWQDVGSLYADAAISANVCVQVPTADIPGGTWSVTNSYGNKNFFTIA